MELQKRVASKLVDEIDPLDRFAFMACSDACVPVGDGEFKHLNPKEAVKARSSLQRLSASGASNHVEVVRVAANRFDSRAEPGRDARLVWFTDGVASAGELRPGKLRDAMQRIAASRKMRTTIVDVGGDTDDANLSALSSGLGAIEVDLDPAMSTTGHVFSVLQTTYGDLLTDVEVELPTDAEAVYPRGYRSVAPGDEIVLMGRVDGVLEGEVKVTGKLRGEPWSQTYPIALTSGSHSNSFLPRMWAAERIRDLELAEETPKDAIVDLSKRYGVLSRFTTLLALESKEMMREYGVKDRDYDAWKGDEAPTSAEPPARPTEESEAPAEASASSTRSGKSNRAPAARPRVPLSLLSRSGTGRSWWWSGASRRPRCRWASGCSSPGPAG